MIRVRFTETGDNTDEASSVLLRPAPSGDAAAPAEECDERAALHLA
jgi:hypothetical protein